MIALLLLCAIQPHEVALHYPLDSQRPTPWHSFERASENHYLLEVIREPDGWHWRVTTANPPVIEWGYQYIRTRQWKSDKAYRFKSDAMRRDAW